MKVNGNVEMTYKLLKQSLDDALEHQRYCLYACDFNAASYWAKIAIAIQKDMASVHSRVYA